MTLNHFNRSKVKVKNICKINSEHFFLPMAVSGSYFLHKVLWVKDLIFNQLILKVLEVAALSLFPTNRRPKCKPFKNSSRVLYFCRLKSYMSSFEHNWELTLISLIALLLRQWSLKYDDRCSN